MRIAIAQIDTRPADLEGNAGRIEGYARRAAQDGCDLLILPMTALCGAEPVAGAAQESFMLDLMETLGRLADSCPLPCLVPIVMDLEGETLPEVVLFQDGAITPLKFMAYTQALRSGSQGGLEDGAAPDLPVIELGGMRVGIAFTYDDIDDYEDDGRDIDLLIYLAGYGYAADDPSSVLGAALLESRYPEDARDLGAWFVGAGSVGGYGTQVYAGSSFVLDPRGALVASAPGFEESLLEAEVGPDAEKGHGLLHGMLSAPEPEVYDRTLCLWQALTLGLHDYFDKLGLGDAVVGLDGSLGSQVVLALATDALGPTRVHALICVPGDDHARRDAEALARNLRVDSRRLPMRAVAASVVNPEPGAELTPTLIAGILEANLASWAEELGGVTLSSADKSGLALDGAANRCSAATLAPLGDVYRTDVLALARMRNTISPVFESVTFDDDDAVDLPGVSRAGYSAETFQAAVDRVLAGYLEWGRSLNELIATSGQDAALIEAVCGRLAEAEPARLGRTLYLIMSSRTLYDERFPLGLAWHDHQRDDGLRELSDDELDAMFDQLVDGVSDDDGHAAGGPSPTSAGTGSLNEVRDVLGDLSDFSFGGGFRPAGFGSYSGMGPRHHGGKQDGGSNGSSGTPGPMGHGEDDGWHSPFSEN